MRRVKLAIRSLRNQGEGVFIAVGIIALVTGILVDVFLLRVVCLAILASAGFLAFASIRAKQLNIRPAASDTPYPPQPGNEMMKKLVFDDYQMHSKDDHPAEDLALPAEPAPAGLTGEIPEPRPVASWPHHKPEIPEPLPEFTVSDFFDVDSDIYRGDPEPRTEFDFLLGKVLRVIKEVLFAHTVAFFWANQEKRQMVLEARATESPLFFTTRRFPMGDDLVSSVALKGKPEFITEVNPVSETEMLPYYMKPASVKSFIGVPVYFSKKADDPMGKHPVAVIAVDSKAADDFGPETLRLLGQFTKLISALIKSYNDKYDLLLDSELLSSIRRLQDRVRNDFSLTTIVQSLGEETSKMINWDFLSIVLYDEGKHAWITQKVTNRSQEGHVSAGQVVDFPGSLVGQAIRTNSHCLVDDLETMPTAVRHHHGEKPGVKGSFLSVPISSLNKCYGAVTLESREKFNFSRRDVEMLYRLAENTAAALEIFYMQEVIKEYVIIDDQTGLFAKKFFLQRLEEELVRADDSGTELAMILITIDKAADIVQRFGNDGFERVMLTLAKAIRSSVRPYDLVARYEGSKFAALLVNTAANDAYVWAEKIRRNLAGLVINIDGKTFSITISLGVCGALEGMRGQEFLGNASTVLTKACEAGGNLVRVY